MTNSDFINCVCGKDVYYRDLPQHYQLKHEWPKDPMQNLPPDSQSQPDERAHVGA